jgi:hypothetical protein
MSPSVLSIWLFLQLRLALKCLNVKSLHARGRRLEASVHFYVFEDKLNRRSVPDAVGLNIPSKSGGERNFTFVM